MNLPSGETREEVVELMDVMPTCLEAAGVEIPDSVDGLSLVSRLRGASDWREVLHGEQGCLGGDYKTGMQFLTDGKEKYIWEPGYAKQYFFDLIEDPEERRNLASEPGQDARIQPWCDQLVEILRDREEGFVQDDRLVRAKSRKMAPEYEGSTEGW